MAAEDGPTGGGPMSESERLERFQRDCGYSEDIEHATEQDNKLSKRIRELLNHPDIGEYNLVDAYYYDYSGIPWEIVDKENFFRDMYFIYGISTKCEIVSKWVERYDLDSNRPIVNGYVEKRK